MLNNSKDPIGKADHDRDTEFVQKINPIKLCDISKDIVAPETYLNVD